jgi:hypothetical protein
MTPKAVDLNPFENLWAAMVAHMEGPHRHLTQQELFSKALKPFRTMLARPGFASKLAYSIENRL